jgi:hypothetical protein
MTPATQTTDLTPSTRVASRPTHAVAYDVARNGRKVLTACGVWVEVRDLELETEPTCRTCQARIAEYEALEF